MASVIEELDHLGPVILHVQLHSTLCFCLYLTISYNLLHLANYKLVEGKIIWSYMCTVGGNLSACQMTNCRKVWLFCNDGSL